MSQDEPALSARKAKRAQRDAERAEKHRDSKKKRKANAVVEEDGAEESAQPAAGIVPAGALDEINATQDETELSGKASKKRKRTQDTGAVVNEEAEDSQTKQKTKKRRRGDGESDKADSGTGKKRFIVFIGNLPYSTTDDSLDKHFAKLKPYTLRHRIDPKTKKSKGFAFVEFDNFDRMKTCLKLYHHSFFDPDNPGHGNVEAPEEYGYPNAGSRKKSKGRKINVELTAGGGGSAEARKEKIRTKNVRLEEQRTRRIEAEKKEKDRKVRKEGDGQADSKAVNTDLSSSKESANPSHGEMHPSRLARMH